MDTSFLLEDVACCILPALPARNSEKHFIFFIIYAIIVSDN